MQDVHAHVWDMRLHFQPATVREADLARGYPLDLTVALEPLLRDMAAVERAVLFGLKARHTGYWVPDEYVAQFVDKAPEKFVGFAGCDPTQPECLDELKHGVEHLGLRGVKIGPTYAGIDPRDARCDPVYRYCQDRGLPIVFHSGTTFNHAAPLRFSRPWLWDDVAIRYPGLKMVLAHVGHPFCEECLVVIRKHPNLHADISALHYRPWQFYNMLIAAQEYRVTHKLLFGSDYPFTTPAASAEGLRSINGLVDGTGLPRVSELAKEEILTRDTFGLLGLPR